MKQAVAAAIAVLSVLPAWANEVVLYEGTDMRGRNVTITRPTPNLGYLGFENRASSLYVISGSWEFCTEPYFRGDCRVFPEGEHPRLGGKNNRISSGRPVADSGGGYRPGNDWGSAGEPEVEVFDRENFATPLRTLRRSEPNFDTLRINDAIASLIVHRGTWQFCTDGNFRGDCVTFGPGRYARLPGRDDKFSSARPVEGGWGGGGGGGWGSGGGGWGGGSGGGSGPARIRLFEYANFSGRSIWLDRNAPDFDQAGFNDRAESVIVEGGRWRLCSDGYGKGECREFGPGQYPVLPRELRNKVSSALRN
jgi:uncharacterized membrane protein YgcG